MNIARETAMAVPRPVSTPSASVATKELAMMMKSSFETRHSRGLSHTIKHQHRGAHSGECSRLKAQREAEGMPQVKFLCALVIMPGLAPSQGQPH